MADLSLLSSEAARNDDDNEVRCWICHRLFLHRQHLPFSALGHRHTIFPSSPYDAASTVTRVWGRRAGPCPLPMRRLPRALPHACQILMKNV
jgi:hypothetical protein